VGLVLDKEMQPEPSVAAARTNPRDKKLHHRFLSEGLASHAANRIRSEAPRWKAGVVHQRRAGRAGVGLHVIGTRGGVELKTRTSRPPRAIVVTLPTAATIRAGTPQSVATQSTKPRAAARLAWRPNVAAAGVLLLAVLSSPAPECRL